MKHIGRTLAIAALAACALTACSSGPDSDRGQFDERGTCTGNCRRDGRRHLCPSHDVGHRRFC